MKNKRILVLWLLTIVIGSSIMGILIQIEYVTNAFSLEPSVGFDFFDALGRSLMFAGLIALFAIPISLPTILVLTSVNYQLKDKPLVVRKRALIFAHVIGGTLTIGVLMYLNYSDGGRLWIICATYALVAAVLWGVEFLRAKLRRANGGLESDE